MNEAAQKAAADLIRPFQDAAVSAKAVADFQAAASKLVLDLPRITNGVAMNVPPIQDFRLMLERLEAIRISEVRLAPEYVGTLRREAKTAVENVEGSERDAVVEAMRSLEEIDDAAHVTPA